MSLIEILIISIGLSLDVYAVVVCQGAVLLNIEKSKLLKMSLFFCAWQVAAVAIGHAVTLIPYLADIAHNVSYIGESISVIIFTVMGAYMLYKAWKNEGILERLSDINYKQLSAAAFFTSLDALFAGMGWSFAGQILYCSLKHTDCYSIYGYTWIVHRHAAWIRTEDKSIRYWRYPAIDFRCRCRT